jgi:hypothetical protein
MRISTARWIVFAVALATPASAYATDYIHHRIHRVEHSAFRAQVDPPVSVNPSLYTASHGRGLPTYVTEGLSRNSKNCAEYGCIDGGFSF